MGKHIWKKPDHHHLHEQDKNEVVGGKLHPEKNWGIARPMQHPHKAPEDCNRKCGA
jgi:hypothetical protein